jgi:hypothetical protein
MSVDAEIDPGVGGFLDDVWVWVQHLPSWVRTDPGRVASLYLLHSTPLAAIGAPALSDVATGATAWDLLARRAIDTGPDVFLLVAAAWALAHHNHHPALTLPERFPQMEVLRYAWAAGAVYAYMAERTIPSTLARLADAHH